jgi:hypothetical protein
LVPASVSVRTLSGHASCGTGPLFGTGAAGWSAVGSGAAGGTGAGPADAEPAAAVTFAGGIGFAILAAARGVGAAGRLNSPFAAVA